MNKEWPPKKKDFPPRRAEISEMKEIQAKLSELQKRSVLHLPEHLEMFNDAVVAIIITIMVLGIPLPSESGISYSIFLRSIFVFLISFFIVADFWYENHQTASILPKVDKSYLVMDFFFLAALALIPIMTKWIMQEHTAFSVANMGIVYFLVNLIRLRMDYAAIKLNFSDSKIGLLFYNRMAIFRLLLIFGLNLVLIIAALFAPSVAMVFYLALPILSFFLKDNPSADSQKKSA